MAFTLCWVFALAATGSTDVLFFLAPALLIAIPLFCGRYFGEELIAKLVARQPRKPLRSLLVPALTPGAPRTWRPRGRRLIAFSLAKRPPPLRLLTEF